MLLGRFTEFIECLAFPFLKRIQEQRRLEIKEIIKILMDELLHEEHRAITGQDPYPGTHSTKKMCIAS